MQYLLMAMESADDFAARSDPQRSEAYWEAWNAYLEALAASGVMTAAAGLQGPDVATTVRVEAGRRVLHDGPFADTKEHLGGYFVIDCKDEADAIERAKRIPTDNTSWIDVQQVVLWHPK